MVQLWWIHNIPVNAQRIYNNAYLNCNKCSIQTKKLKTTITVTTHDIHRIANARGRPCLCGGQIIAGMPLSCCLESAQCLQHDDLSFAFWNCLHVWGMFFQIADTKGCLSLPRWLPQQEFNFSCNLGLEHSDQVWAWLLLVRPLFWLIESYLLPNCCFDVPYDFI